jgi:hypothetical protein
MLKGLPNLWTTAAFISLGVIASSYWIRRLGLASLMADSACTEGGLCANVVNKDFQIFCLMGYLLCVLVRDNAGGN